MRLLFIIIFLFSLQILSQTVLYDSIPSTYQLYPRNLADNDSGIVTLKIFNILGETVNVLMDEKMEKGTYNINWNGTDIDENQVSSGVYFYQLLLTNDRIFTETKKCFY